MIFFRHTAHFDPLETDPLKTTPATRRLWGGQVRALCVGIILMMPCSLLSSVENSSWIAAWNEVNKRPAALKPNELRGIATKIKTTGKVGELIATMLICRASELEFTNESPEKKHLERISASKTILAFVQKNFIELPAAVGDNPEVIAEVALWFAKGASFNPAIEMLDQVGMRSPARNRVLLGIALSKIYAAKSDWNEAIRVAKLAADTASSLYQGDDENGTAEIREKASENLNRLQWLRDVAIHGLGYRLYYDANVKRLQLKKPQEALDIYLRILKLYDDNNKEPAANIELLSAVVWLDKIDLEKLPIHPIYFAAAKYGALACRYENSDLDPQDKDCVESVQFTKSPFYPASGLIVADALLANGQTTNAGKLIQHLLDWLNNPVVDNIYKIPEQSKEKVSPGKSMRQQSSMGKVEWFSPRPNEVYTVDNTIWWSKYLKLQCLRRLALIQYLAGDINAAKESLRSTISLDELDAELTERKDRTNPSNYLRLIDGIDKGKFYITKDEMASFPSSVKSPLLLAEWSFECEEWEVAIKNYKIVEEEKTLGNNARAYLAYAKSCAYIYLDNPKVANGLLSQFFVEKSPWRNTPTYYRAVFAQASIEKPATAKQTYERALTGNCTQEFRASVLLKLAQLSLSTEDYSATKEYLLSYKKLFKDTESPQYKIALQLEQLSDQRASRKPTK